MMNIWGICQKMAGAFLLLFVERMMRMKLFGKLFRGRDAPSNSTVGSGYGFFMGNTAAGKRVNARSAMQMTAVYSCVRILAEAVAGLPLQFYRYTENGGKEKAVNHPLYFLVHDEPNPEMTSFVFRETLMTHLLLWGNAYSQIIRNGKGEIMALYPLMPDRMTVDKDDVDGRTGTDPGANGKLVRLQPSDVLHIPGLGFDGLVGYSPIAMAKNAIGLAIAAEEYGSKFYANGAAPSGVLEHPGTLKDPGRVRESWQSTFGGSGNANKVERLLEKIKKGEINCVIVKDFSRFGRDYIELGDYLERIFPFMGVRFISINDHYDSNDYKGTTGGLDVVMKNIVYDYYSKDLSMKVKTAKYQKMKQGKYLGGHVPYGLMKDPKDKHKLITDPEAAAVVREIFDMAIAKMRMIDMARTLNERGVETPGQYYRRRHPGTKRFINSSDKACWTHTNLRTILKQGIYRQEYEPSGDARSSYNGQSPEDRMHRG
mgnify:CR=1 FL=1